jgi:hypothetical protein
MSPQPHDSDVKALVRIAVVWNIPIACNRTSADYLITSPLLGLPGSAHVPLAGSRSLEKPAGPWFYATQIRRMATLRVRSGAPRALFRYFAASGGKCQSHENPIASMPKRDTGEGGNRERPPPPVHLILDYADVFARSTAGSQLGRRGIPDEPSLCSLTPRIWCSCTTFRSKPRMQPAM